MEKQSNITRNSVRFGAIFIVYTVLLSIISYGNVIATTCSAPSNLLISNILGSGATLSWTSSGSVNRFEVNVLDSTTGVWTTANTTISGTATSYRIGSNVALVPNRTYQARIRAVCSNGTRTAFQFTNRFRTTNVTACSFPYNLAVKSITSVGATFLWESSTSNLSSYELRYRALNGSWFSSGQLTARTSYVIRRTNLQPARTYEWLVVGTCANGDKISIAGSVFTTPILPYCSEPTGLFITELSNVGATFNWNATNNTSQHKIYIKAANETTWKLIGSINGAITSFRFGDMRPNTTYSWYMQSTCNNGDLPLNKYFGPDFTTTDLPMCSSPTNLTLSNMSDIGATFSWNGDTTFRKNYEIEVRKVSTNAIVYINRIVGNSVTIRGAMRGREGLLANTEYSWKLRTYCQNNDRQPWVLGSNFITNCNAPSALAISNLSSENSVLAVTFSWAGGTNIQNFELQYKKVGANDWINISEVSAALTSVVQTGLALGSSYEWRMRSLCTDGDINAWVNGASFIGNQDGGRIADNEQWADNLRLYPNPSRGIVQLALGAQDEENVNIGVFNALGQTVATHTSVVASNETLSLDLSHLPSGVYFLKITNGTSAVTRQLVIESR